MENTEDVQLLHLGEHHLTSLVQLYRLVFGKKRTEEYFRKKYLSGFQIQDVVASVAIHDEKVIAFVGAIPQMFDFGDREGLVAHACEYLTHPQYRNRGIHKQLVALTNKRLLANGVNMIYAYFSEVSKASVKSLGWDYPRHLHYGVIQTNAIPLQKVRYKFLGQTKWKSFIKNLTPGTLVALKDDLPTEVLNDELLSYRSFTDNGIFELEGCVFWIKLSEVLHVGKFATSDFNCFKNGLNTLTRYCRLHGVDKIVFQVDSAGPEFRFLEQYGLELKSGAHLGIHFLSAPLEVSHLRFTYSSFDNF